MTTPTSAHSLADVRAVLFDLDGTLIDSAPDIADAVNRALGDEGFGPCTQAQVRDWIGGGAQGLIWRCLRHLSHDEPAAEQVAAISARFLDHYAELLCVRTTIYPGVQVCLNALQHAGLALACVTNKSERFTGQLLDHLGLAHWFDPVICGDTLSARKPDPLPLLHACERFSLEPHQALMIGDSRADLVAAQRAGVPAIYVTYGYNQGVDLSTLGPVGSIACLSQLPERLGALASISAPARQIGTSVAHGA